MEMMLVTLDQNSVTGNENNTYMTALQLYPVGMTFF